MPIQLTDADRKKVVAQSGAAKQAAAERVAAARLADALEALEKAGDAAHDFGLQISPEAIAEMNKLPTMEARIELASWLAKPENYDTVTHPLMGLSPEKQCAKIREYAQREDVKGSINTPPDVEAYIDERKAARREGRRR
jgi:hypothetical protein